MIKAENLKNVNKTLVAQRKNELLKELEEKIDKGLENGGLQGNEVIVDIDEEYPTIVKEEIKEKYIKEGGYLNVEVSTITKNGKPNNCTRFKFRYE